MTNFNTSKPFDIIRAEDLGDSLYAFYEPFEEYLLSVSKIDIRGSRPVFVIGGRGTGKTMILKFLQFNMQLDYFQSTNKCEINKSTISKFLNEKKFIGTYLRFKSTEFDSMKDELSELFPQYFTLKVINEFLSTLIRLKSYSIISDSQEKEIIDFFNTCIIFNEPSNKSDSLLKLKSFIQDDLFPAYSKIINMHAFYELSEIKNMVNVPIIDSKRLFIDFLTFTHKILKDTNLENILILLDELEYINSEHKKFIYQLIKNVDESPISIKVGSRYLESNMEVGNSGEFLEDIHDYRLIKINEIIQTNQSGYRSIVKKILNKRLEKSKYNISFQSIDNLFKTYTVEEEAINVIKNKKSKHWNTFITFLTENEFSEIEIKKIVTDIEYPENPLIEKLNMLLIRKGKNSKYIREELDKYLKKEPTPYSDLYSKYKNCLLYQLCHNYKIDKDYSGIDSIIQLSSGTIRHAIEICNQSMNNVLFAKSEEYILENGIESKYQNFAITQYSNLQYNNIAGIPNNLGTDIQMLVNLIGNIFRKLHLVDDIVEPEQTHFEINLKEIKSEKVKEIMNIALNHSILQNKKPMIGKDASIQNMDDIYLNKIFAPYFKISYRLRGRSKLKAIQLERLIENKDKYKISTEIIVANTKKSAFSLTKNLFNYMDNEDDS